MKSKMKNLILPAVIVLAVAVYFIIAHYTQQSDYHEKYADRDLTVDVSEVSREGTYSEYLENHADAELGSGEYHVDIAALSDSDSASSVVDGSDYHDEGCDAPYSQVVYAAEDGYVEWKVTVEEAGFYYMNMTYFPVESRGIDIERCLYINGEMPFSGADDLTFSLVWADGGEITMDNQGNEIRPSQVEVYRWESEFFKDYMGYQVDPYQFYLEKGENTIRLESVNEPVIIGDITITAEYEIPTYADYSDSVAVSAEHSAEYADYCNIVEGETSTARSSASLYEVFDRSSSETSPSSVAKTKMNMIGGNNWRVAGQWIEWEIEVPEDGYYNLSVKARQSYERGTVSNRALYIDGEIPFEEVGVIAFEYNTNWTLMTLSDEDGTPYEFYLTEGTHTIRMEVTMGELGSMLQELEDSVYRMNKMYRKILVLTGTEPDAYRDYHIDKVYPEVMEAMDLESARLYEIVDRLTEYTGQKGSNIATAQTLAVQMEKFCNHPGKIPKQLSNFKENVTSLGTSVLNLSEAALDIDYIVVSAPGAELPKVKETFLKKAVHECKSFVASFFNDYNNLGNVYDSDEAITVWMFSGRDQSTILKTMIDDTFTPETGIAVNVKLVETGTLLPAVVAGTGPDVALAVSQGEPVNFALRNAAVDISEFEGIDEVLAQYNESAYVPFEYEDGLYALPETQNYPVMFYRTDILEELGLEPPETWEDLIGMLPTIQNNNLNVGVPSTERKINNVSTPDMSLFYSMLYQNGGVMYNDTHSKTLMDSEAGVAGFEFLTKLFTQYKLPTEYDAKSRFRTGEMPIVIGDYSMYNELSVSAPEIKGLWDFTIIPGTEREDEDGNTIIDHSTTSWGTASMMLAGCDNQEAAWEFMKWWADSETQVRYGRELESVMGEAARYATANTVAFEQLSWSSSQVSVLEEQRDWVIGTPEVAGGYYTNRHIVNAVRKVINDNEDPRETLLDYTRTINEELTNKREEFGLPTYEEEEE